MSFIKATRPFSTDAQAFFKEVALSWRFDCCLVCFTLISIPKVKALSDGQTFVGFAGFIRIILSFQDLMIAV